MFTLVRMQQNNGRNWNLALKPTISTLACNQTFKRKPDCVVIQCAGGVK